MTKDWTVNIFPLSAPDLYPEKQTIWDGKFNGTYEFSKYNDCTLENDIQNAGCGIWTVSAGGLYRESDSRIDVWGPGDNNGHYDHWYYNGPDDYGKAPDNRHDN